MLQSLQTCSQQGMRVKSGKFTSAIRRITSAGSTAAHCHELMPRFGVETMDTMVAWTSSMLEARHGLSALNLSLLDIGTGAEMSTRICKLSTFQDHSLPIDLQSAMCWRIHILPLLFPNSMHECSSRHGHSEKLSMAPVFIQGPQARYSEFPAEILQQCS